MSERRHSGRSASCTASATPRVDCWWTSSSAEGKTQTGTMTKQPVSSVTDCSGRPVPPTDYTYEYWALHPRPVRKLSPRQIQQSVERLSQPHYLRNRPHSAPITRTSEPRPPSKGSTPEKQDGLRTEPIQEEQEEEQLADGQSKLDKAETDKRPSTAQPLSSTRPDDNFAAQLPYAFGFLPKTKKLSPETEAEMVERLYKVKDVPEIPEKRCVKLAYQYDGAEGYKETWVPVKQYTKEEATQALLKLRERTDEKIKKLQQKLEEKYLQPLCVSKKVNLMDAEFKEKIDLLYRGQGTVKHK